MPDGSPANVIVGSVVIADLTPEKERYMHLVSDDYTLQGVTFTHVMRERFGNFEHITFRGHTADGNSVVTSFRQNQKD